MKKLQNVLIVDDSLTAVQVIKRMLEKLEVTESVTTTNSVTEALDIFSKRKDESLIPDLILLDLHMGAKGGFDFLHHYSQLEPSLTEDFKPVICIVSQYLGQGENHEIGKQYRHVGVAEQFRKPLEKDDILELLDEHENHFRK